MEDEDVRDYKEPCPQCSEVNWGLTDEGTFYCRSCHTLIERTREVISGDVTSNARGQSISRGLRKKTQFEKGWEWYICEGFQYILQKQAEALQSLGVSSQIKDEVLWNLWKKYLQKSRQPYCDKLPSDATSDALPASDSGNEVNTELDIVRLLGLSGSDTDLVSESSIGETSFASGMSDWSGSVDGSLYLQNKKKGKVSMSMPMTLAFCYMALLWLRESITLSDLLRLVMDGHIPYMNAYTDFPEEMKVYVTEFKIFHVESWPVYEDVHKKMQFLATYLELPRFPDITDGSFFHPNILCMKYLMEANLPDDMHNWTCRVVKEIGIGEVDFLTLQPGNKTVRKVKYDIIAVAVVIVVLKILFVLNDEYEWQLSNHAEERNKKRKEGCPVFDIKRWYKVVKKAMDVEQKKLEEERVRYLWRSKQPFFYIPRKKCVALKKRQMVTVLQRQFRSLSDTVEFTEKKKPSSFHLHWTEDDPERPCFHGHCLDGILQQEGHILNIHGTDYWLCTTKLCKEKECGHLAHYKESDFPHTYRFVLSLFSFILRVQPSLIHEEVCVVEHRFFRGLESPRIKKRKKKKHWPKQQCEDLHE
ncbi:TATA box-binding protein-associated factor RNA polymerase I subunit B isoform X2 [Heteronotia binoei]|uniref:TATA box-binding protein-associated factor RNA polymerase I subunit B isoform X2 n=1 Tax=Heteronotia binoei TaxID=13085 RepID=UPI00293166AA|nr:TATA box-binding protein-associated factor RNA polymerase I subunit B isoform X2 [Heteronotia binoei]